MAPAAQFHRLRDYPSGRTARCCPKCQNAKQATLFVAVRHSTGEKLLDDYLRSDANAGRRIALHQGLGSALTPVMRKLEVESESVEYENLKLETEVDAVLDRIEFKPKGSRKARGPWRDRGRVGGRF